jgi:hypothetical protein
MRQAAQQVKGGGRVAPIASQYCTLVDCDLIKFSVVKTKTGHDAFRQFVICLTFKCEREVCHNAGCAFEEHAFYKCRNLGRADINVSFHIISTTMIILGKTRHT